MNAETEPAHERIERPSMVQLFRFSAVTWNAHRVHFDRDHARAEGYPDVIVHSHLLGSFMGRLVTDWLPERSRLRELSWRNRRPAIVGDEIICRARFSDSGTAGQSRIVLEEVSRNGELIAEGLAIVDQLSIRERNPKR
jgi:hydroxyacyl-ACP dehydratase HTD2-like protein with hotdog domain